MSKRINYVLSQKYRQHASPREIFIHKKRILERTEPFTSKQTKQLTLQQRNYIRGIQIARNIKKSDAIKLYRKTFKDTKLLKNLSDEISRKYEVGITIEPLDIQPPIIEGYERIEKKKEKKKEKKREKKKKRPKKLKKRLKKLKKSKKEKGALKGRKYKYAGKFKKATKKQLARFRILPGSARHYIDIKTGEEISRRERDKRL